MISNSAPDALAVLRTARGLTQQELSQRSGISQALLSKIESGLVPLDEVRAVQLARSLDAPFEFFLDENFAAAESRIFHRKQASLPIKADKRIRAEAALLQAQVGALLGDALPELTLRKEAVPDDGYYTPADIAKHVRQDWGLGSEPIGDLVALVERAGIMVLSHDMKSVRVDAIATWPQSGAPLILLADHVPGDRQRFTVAHELGHAVMHDHPVDDQEQQADEFASEFLMPATAMRVDLKDTSFTALLALKEKWGVSIASLARRARDLNLMTESQYRNFNIYMSSSGMKKSEPIKIQAENPTLVLDVVRDRLADGVSVEELAGRAVMTVEDFRRRFVEGVA